MSEKTPDATLSPSAQDEAPQESAGPAPAAGHIEAVDQEQSLSEMADALIDQIRGDRVRRFNRSQ